MRKKLFIYGVVASLIAVLITSTIAFIIVRNSVIEENKMSAQSMASMFINLIDEDTEYDVLAKSLHQETTDDNQIPYRVTFISRSGKVLGDSDANIDTMDNHADRPEIQEASRLGVGSARRNSATLKTNMLYVAVKDSGSGLIVRVALPLTELQRMSYSLLVGCLISLMVGIVVSIIGSLIFSGRLSKPIRKLAVAAKKLSEGNMDSKVSLKTNTELDELANDFNEMSLRLNNSLSHLRHKNSEFDAVLSSMEDGLIAVDVNQEILYINPAAMKLFRVSDSVEGNKISSLLYKKPILEALTDCIAKNKSQKIMQKIGLEEALDFSIYIYPMLYRGKLSGAIIIFRDITHVLELERLRTDFVANVSHELKTPLTSIKGYAQALHDDGFENNDNNKRFLDIIEIEADRLNTLINDLMELSKIENKSEDVDISEHNLKEIVLETTELVSIEADKKKVEIKVDIPADIKVYVNKDRLKQLLLNLMDNGIKYNKQKGKLFVGASEHNGMLKVTIEDTGVGMDKKDMERLFERFYRVDRSRSKELGGTGLGLSIVKHIAELYGGSVTVESEKGKGTEFQVTLPILK